jgi:hypothetical protein
LFVLRQLKRPRVDAGSLERGRIRWNSQLAREKGELPKEKAEKQKERNGSERQGSRAFNTHSKSRY